MHSPEATVHEVEPVISPGRPHKLTKVRFSDPCDITGSEFDLDRPRLSHVGLTALKVHVAMIGVGIERHNLNLY